MTIIITLLIFGLIITLHEFGHFLFAKLFGVRVNEFAFGMGPKLFSRQKGETLYSVRAFPIGGFLAMEGEDSSSEENRAVEPGRSFLDKKPWQRFCILFGGAAMNIILGFFILLILSSRMELMGTNVVASTVEGAAVTQHVQPGDRIVSVNGHSTNSYNDVVFQLLRDEDGVIDLGIRANADPKAVLGQGMGEPVSILQGVTFAMEDAVEGRKTVRLDMTFFGVPNSFMGAIGYSVNWTVSVVKQVWFSLVDIVTGRYGLNDLSGPVGTAAVVDQVRSYGLDSLLMLLAFITINVGVFNLLPLPALDGGRLLFLVIEVIFRKPVPAKYEGYIHASGMLLLLSFVAVVTLNDIFKLFR